MAIKRANKLSSSTNARTKQLTGIMTANQPIQSTKDPITGRTKLPIGADNSQYIVKSDQAKTRS